MRNHHRSHNSFFSLAGYPPARDPYFAQDRQSQYYAPYPVAPPFPPYDPRYPPRPPAFPQRPGSRHVMHACSLDSDLVSQEATRRILRAAIMTPAHPRHVVCHSWLCALHLVYVPLAQTMEVTMTNTGPLIQDRRHIDAA